MRDSELPDSGVCRGCRVVVICGLELSDGGILACSFRNDGREPYVTEHKHRRGRPSKHYRHYACGAPVGLRDSRSDSCCACSVCRAVDKAVLP